MINKRSGCIFTLVTLLSLLSMLFAACAPPTPGNTSNSAGGVIKAGLLAPLTGVGAASGKDMVNGWNLWWKLHGNKLCDGKAEIQTVVQDTASVPDTARNKARFLVEQSGVSFIVGPLFANEGLAVATYTKTKGIPLFWPTTSNDNFTQRQRSNLIIRVVGRWGMEAKLPHFAIHYVGCQSTCFCPSAES